MRILIEGNSRHDNSYGIVNTHLADALRRRGHEVFFDAWDQNRKDALASQDALGIAHLPISDGAEMDACIRQIWPPVWDRPKARTFVVIQPYEPGAVPVAWLGGLAKCDRVWVPSRFAKACWLQGGADPRAVEVVPNGVGPMNVSPSLIRQDKTLLFLGGGIVRKGIDVAFAALDGFADLELAEITFVVKENGHDSHYRNQSLIEELLAKHPRVAKRTRVIREKLSKEQLADLVASSAALVLPYRAEGFALPLLEAMALGVPVIATAGGAADDFLNDANSLRVPAQKQLLTTTHDPTSGPSGGPRFWLEPDPVALAQSIRTALFQQGAVAPLAENARLTASGFTWDRAAEIAEASLLGCSEGGTVKDTFTEAESNVNEYLSDPVSSSGLARAANSLAALGDLWGAKNLFDLAAGLGVMGVPDAARAQIDQLCVQNPDVWANARHRLRISSARRYLTAGEASSHAHEGDLEATARTATFLGSFFSACKRVLDIGCGEGAMLRVLRKAGVQGVGIEGDPERVEHLCEDGLDVVCGMAPGALEQYDEASFDGIFIGHLVEHLTSAQLQSLLSECARVTAEGGTIVIQTPDISQPLVSSEIFWLDHTHIRPYPVAVLKELLWEAGFAHLEGASGSLAPVAPLDIFVAARRMPAAPSVPAAVPPASGGKRISYAGLLGGSSGFAVASAAMIAAAEATPGLKLFKTDLNKGIPFRWPSTGESLPEIAVVDAPLAWINAAPNWPTGKLRVLRTTFETKGLSAERLEVTEMFDEIWTMSSYDRQVLAQAGLAEEKLRLVPPFLTRMPNRELVESWRETRPFGHRLLSVFNYEERKNPRALIEAFSMLASTNTNARLTVKVSGISAAQFAQTAIGGWGIPIEVMRRVELIDTHLTNDQLAALYLDSDAFVLPSRGEGFGLPYLEALSHGMPVIAPEVGGHRDFCGDENSILVPAQEVPAGDSLLAPIFAGTRWLETDPADLAEAMAAAMKEDVVAQLGSRAAKSAEAWNLGAMAATVEHWRVLAG